jgi:hypothetical protein
MLNRQMVDVGIHPIMGYLLILAGFLGGSFLLFERTELAPAILILAALTFVARLSEIRRNVFLMAGFKLDDYYLIRFLENFLVTLPFALFLAFRLQFLYMMLLQALSAFLAFTSFRDRSGQAVPTPFSQRPFEFATGFRRTFPAFLLAYFLVVMAVISGNSNIGIFALILVFLICISYYFNPEDIFYVWIFNVDPGRFLWKKMTTAFLHTSLLAVPVILTLVMAYPEKYLITVGFFGLGLIYLAAVILAKYASYPEQVSLPQFIMLAFSVWFPPLLVAVIPYFYLQSARKLKAILG